VDALGVRQPDNARRKTREATNQQVTDRRQISTFRYKPTEVLAAARERVTHHTERGDWWTKEYNRAEEQLKKKGFEYRERQTSYEPQIQIVGDPELAQRVAHCRQKSAEHREKQNMYETWVRALKAKAERQPGEEMELTINDVVFFGL
jgi:hypothetical protein